MAHAQPFPAPPAEPAWDIAFTRLAKALRPRLQACAGDLARRFQAIGLGCEMQFRQTPRGVASFLALVGGRGLVCIVEMTLVDGMAVDRGPSAALDIRLLDACGDVAVEGLARGVPSPQVLEALSAQAPDADPLEQAATAVYVAALAHFDLLRLPARPA